MTQGNECLTSFLFYFHIMHKVKEDNEKQFYECNHCKTRRIKYGEGNLSDDELKWLEFNE